MPKTLARLATFPANVSQTDDPHRLAPQVCQGSVREFSFPNARNLVAQEGVDLAGQGQEQGKYMVSHRSIKDTFPASYNCRCLADSINQTVNACPRNVSPLEVCRLPSKISLANAPSKAMSALRASAKARSRSCV
jgi:hypothetical protein